MLLWLPLMLMFLLLKYKVQVRKILILFVPKNMLRTMSRSMSTISKRLQGKTAVITASTEG